MSCLLRYTNPDFSLDAVKQLFRAYNAALAIDLTFQNFDEELASLPGKYAPDKEGQLYLLKEEDAFIGCAAFYAFAPAVAEAKSLFVLPSHQGKGYGKLLLQTIIADTRTLGYTTLYLDSLRLLTAARALYERLGFQEIPPYNRNPNADVYYMALSL